MRRLQNISTRSRGAARFVLASVMALFIGLAALLITGSAAVAQVRSSLPFRTLAPVQPPLAGLIGDTPAGKIEVIQFFYYGCPHCFDAQPLIEDWLAKKPADVEFRYVPALRDEKWVPLSKAYFTLEKLGEVGRLHRPIYDVINFDGAQIGEEAKLVDWVVRNGVERNRFLEVYNSDEVKAKLEVARKLTVDYGIRAPPPWWWPASTRLPAVWPAATTRRCARWTSSATWRAARSSRQAVHKGGKAAAKQQKNDSVVTAR